MRGTVLSISVLSVAAGIGLALADVVSFDPEDAAIVYLIELALIVTLFSDGLFVERELLFLHRGPTGPGAGDRDAADPGLLGWPRSCSSPS